MRRASILVLVVALALMALAPAATAGVGGGPAYVECNGGGKVGSPQLTVEVDGQDPRTVDMQSCPEMLKA